MQLMNSALVGYEELSRFRRVLSTSAEMLNSSYPSRPHSLIANNNNNSFDLNIIQFTASLARTSEMSRSTDVLSVLDEFNSFYTPQNGRTLLHGRT